MVCVLRATATHIHFDSTRRVPCVQSRLSRRDDSQMKVAGQGRRNMTKRDRKKRMETGHAAFQWIINGVAFG